MATITRLSRHSQKPTYARRTERWIGMRLHLSNREVKGARWGEWLFADLFEVHGPLSELRSPRTL